MASQELKEVTEAASPKKGADQVVPFVPAAKQDKHILFGVAYGVLIFLFASTPFILLPVTFQMIAYSASILYIACHRSIALVGGEEEEEIDENMSSAEREKLEKEREEQELEQGPEFMTRKDALMMPVISGTALTTLFFAYKYLGASWVNFLLGIYLSLSGAVAAGLAIHPVIVYLMPQSVDEKVGFEFDPSQHKWLYYLFDEQDLGTKPIKVTFSTLLSISFGIFVSVGFFMTKNFVLHNIIAVSFSILAISMLSLDTFKIGFVLLAGLFFYDIFFVFATPVMVGVAKQFDGPAKIIFPVALDPLRASILGLGDIIIPGFFVAMCLRFDAFLYKRAEVVKFPQSEVHAFAWPKTHFNCVLIGYCLCLVLTSAIMMYFQAAQPALLYLCPGVSIALTFSAWRHGQLKEMWDYSEHTITGEEEKEQKRQELADRQKKELEDQEKEEAKAKEAAIKDGEGKQE